MIKLICSIYFNQIIFHNFVYVYKNVKSHLLNIIKIKKKDYKKKPVKDIKSLSKEEKEKEATIWL